MRVKFTPRSFQGLTGLNNPIILMARELNPPSVPIIIIRSNWVRLKKETWKRQLKLGDVITFKDGDDSLKVGKLIRIPATELFVSVRVETRRVCKVAFDSIIKVVRN